MKKSNVLLAIMLAMPLVACMGSDPYTDLQVRVGKASTMANNTVVEAQNTLRCPNGMRPVQHEVRITNDTNVEYQEEHGRSGGRSSRGRLSGSYATYSGADVTVEAETEAESQGEIRCVPIIDLTPARP